MYKILIKKPQLPKDTFTFYSETASTVNDETGEVTKTTALYGTDNLSDLADKYQSSFSNIYYYWNESSRRSWYYYDC